MATTSPAGGGDLWTEDEYENFLLTVTFRAESPLHAGLWLRASDSQPGPRVEISQDGNPVVFPGSVVLPGKGLAMANLRADLLEVGGWNTLSIEVRGRRVVVWVNGEEVGAVYCVMPAKGRIGLCVGSGAADKNVELAVREVTIQRLPDEEAKTQSGG